jgi:hypothetical protein
VRLCFVSSLEERLNQSRSEYYWGLDQAERIRMEEERIEAQLREKLSQVNTQVNDVSDRVHQLRQLEEEFNSKDLRIQQLETEIAKYETQVALMNQLITKQVEGGAASAGAAAAAADSAAPAAAAAATAASSSAATSASSPSLASALAAPAAAVPASSPSPPPAQPGAVLDPNFSSGGVPAAEQPATATAAQSPAADAAVPGLNADATPAAAAAKDEPIKTDTDASMTAVAPAASTAGAVKTEGEAAPVTAAPSGVIAVDPSGVAFAPAAAAAPSSAVPAAVPGAAGVTGAAASTPALATSSLGPLLPLPATSSVADLLSSIHSATTTIAQLSMSLKLHEEQLESSNRHLIDRDRAMKYMTEQIERFSNLNHELNYKLKAAENLTLEERAKLEQSYKQILFAQRQKDEQSSLLLSYEEKLKVFEQLLNVADVRASAAEEHVADMLQTVKTSRMAGQVLQIAYNKLVKEYEQAVVDKYRAMEEAQRFAAVAAAVTVGGKKLNNDASGSSGLHAHLHAFDSNASEGSATGASPQHPSSSSLSMGAIKEEHHHHDGGFGGINGLASPMDLAHQHRPAHFDAALAAHGGSRLFETAFAHHPLPAAALLPGTLPGTDGASGSEAHYQRISMQLTQQNKELSIKLNQMTHQNTQLQVALVKLAQRAHKSAPLLTAAASAAAGSTYLTSSPPPPVAAAAAASSSSPSHHGHSGGGMKAELSPHQHHSNGHSIFTASAAPRAPDRAQAMDIDGPTSGVAAAASSAVSVPVLSSNAHIGLSKSSSGGGAPLHHRTSSPLPTPRSPLPPLHPNKPVFHDEGTES